MVLTLGYVHIAFDDVSSLKGRRALLNSLKDRLKRENLSLIDLSGAYAKEGDLAFAFLSHDNLLAAQYRARIEDILEAHLHGYFYTIEYETL